MRRRPTEQVTEPAERVGPDDVALVGREVPLHLALGGVDVEVIEPEVDHDLFELPLALDRTHEPRGLHLRHDPDRALLGRRPLVQRARRHLGIGGLVARRRSRILLVQLGDRHREAGQRRQRSLDGAIVQPPRLELSLDPGREPDRLHALDVAGSRTEGQTRQRVDDRRVVGRRGGRGGVRRCARSQHAEREQDGDESDAHRSVRSGRSPRSRGSDCRCCWRCCRCC